MQVKNVASHIIKRRGKWASEAVNRQKRIEPNGVFRNTYLSANKEKLHLICYKLLYSEPLIFNDPTTYFDHEVFKELSACYCFSIDILKNEYKKEEAKYLSNIKHYPFLIRKEKYKLPLPQDLENEYENKLKYYNYTSKIAFVELNRNQKNWTRHFNRYSSFMHFLDKTIDEFENAKLIVEDAKEKKGRNKHRKSTIAIGLATLLLSALAVAIANGWLK